MTSVSPSRLSRSHSQKRTSILLALAWYSPAVHRGIIRHAREAGWILDTAMERYKHHFSLWREDGIIFWLHADPALYEFIKKTDKPVVNIGNGKQPGVPTVKPDVRKIGVMAADYFFERGFRDMAFFLKSHAPAARERWRAFRARAEELGARAHLMNWLRHSGGRVQYSEAALVEWLGESVTALPKPLAIMAEHDEHAIEAIHACIQFSIPIPEQVAVLGVNNDPLRCEFAPVPLSSIDSNHEVMGHEAAVLLDRILNGETPPAAPVLIPPAGVVTRQSTDMMAIRHPHVATVLHHIWQNYTRAINAKTVAALVPLSYQRLHAAFLKNVGRTIADEITHKRMEKARELLAGTTKKAYDIALECGFPNDDRMGRVFRRVLGVTPMEYRQQNRKRG
ncbi:MAG: DNA-binding transcriptional regulator [Opitutaceae bacterium]|jgi:LacI family transcriptional regulator|nr:DNA-binding transcriptional regulator [Opitutaceae bacterium]